MTSKRVLGLVAAVLVVSLNAACGDDAQRTADAGVAPDGGASGDGMGGGPGPAPRDAGRDGSQLADAGLDAAHAQDAGTALDAGSDANRADAQACDDSIAEKPGDGIDQNCDGEETCYVDADDDGHRLKTTLVSADPDCDDPGEARASDPIGDCDDDSAAVSPDAAEGVGDEIDQNCDGEETCYVDADDDGHRLTTTLVSADLDCDDLGEALASDPIDDCDDADGNRYPGNADTTIDGADQNCDLFDTAAIFTDDWDDASFSPQWTTTYYATTSNDLDISSSYSVSLPDSVNLGGSGSIMASQTFDTSSCDSVLWRYWIKRGPDAPELVDTLTLQYWNGGAWVTTDSYTGNASTDSAFVMRVGGISAADARRTGFRLRLITSGGDSLSDDFFVDDFAAGCAPDEDSDGTGNSFDCAPTDADHWSDCGGTCVDADGDHYGPGCNRGTDCAPGDAAQHPGAADTTTDGTDQNCDGHDGPLTLSTYSTGAAVAITDAGGSATTCNAAGAASSAIVVSDIGTIFDVDVTLNISHARASDLDVWLYYNNGADTGCIQLSTDNPTDTPPSPDTIANFTSTVFSDEAAFGIDVASSIAVVAPPFTASFRPETGTPLSGVDGLANATTWTLYVSDDTASSTGSITGWSLSIQYY